MVKKAEGDRVVLLHGLWQSNHALEGLADILNREGYETVNVPYRSFRDTLPEIAAKVADMIGTSEKPTHFVSHSMGGIVIRQLAHQSPELVTGRIVMIAPPNQGSEIIDWLGDCPFARWVLGRGGMSLSTENVRTSVPDLPAANETGIIMGTRPGHALFRHVLPAENDGTVSVGGGRLPGLTDFTTTPASHLFIHTKPEVIAQVRTFLKEGKFKLFGDGPRAL